MEMYYEAYERDGWWEWKIYHYNSTGNREVVVHESKEGFGTKEDAQDDCVEFMEDNNIDAQPA